MREELVMHGAMALVDHLQTLDRAMKDIAVRGPLDPVSEQRDRNDQPPFPGRVVDMLPAEIKSAAGDQQREAEVDCTMIPGRRFFHEFLAKDLLAL